MIGAIMLGVGITGVNGVGKNFVASLALIYGIPAGLTLLCAVMLQYGILAPALSLPSFRLPLLFRSKSAGATA